MGHLFLSSSAGHSSHTLNFVRATKQCSRRFFDRQGCVVVSFLRFCARPPPSSLNFHGGTQIILSNDRTPSSSLTDRSPEVATQDAIGAFRPDGEIPLLVHSNHSSSWYLQRSIVRLARHKDLVGSAGLPPSVCTPRDECFVAPVPPSRLPFDTIPPPQRDRHMRRARWDSMKISLGPPVQAWRISPRLMTVAC